MKLYTQYMTDLHNQQRQTLQALRQQHADDMNAFTRQQQRERDLYQADQLRDIVVQCQITHQFEMFFDSNLCINITAGQIQNIMNRYDAQQTLKREGLQRRHQQEQDNLRHQQQTTFQAQQRKKWEFEKGQKLLQLVEECQRRHGNVIVNPMTCIYKSEMALMDSIIPTFAHHCNTMYPLYTIRFNN